MHNVDFPTPPFWFANTILWFFIPYYIMVYCFWIKCLFIFSSVYTNTFLYESFFIFANIGIFICIHKYFYILLILYSFTYSYVYIFIFRFIRTFIYLYILLSNYLYIYILTYSYFYLFIPTNTQQDRGTTQGKTRIKRHKPANG